MLNRKPFTVGMLAEPIQDTHTLPIPLGYLKRVGVKIFNLYVQSCFLFYFLPFCQLCFFSNFVKNDRKPISLFPLPFIVPDVQPTSIYSSYLAWRPKEERKVKRDVKLSSLLWLKMSLGGGKLAVYPYQGQEGGEQGLAWVFRMCAFSSTHLKKGKRKSIKRRREERIFWLLDEWLETPESYSISKKQSWVSRGIFKYFGEENRPK